MKNRLGHDRARLIKYAAGLSIISILACGLWLVRPGRQFNYNALRCQAEPQAAAPLTAQQLTDILLIPERTKVAGLSAVLPGAVCSLPDLEVRSGAVLKRKVYRLSFNEQVVLVVGIEGDEYVGFRIRGLKEGASSVVEDRPLSLYQNWQVKVGDEIKGAQVIGSLGQVNLRLDGRNVVAPFDGSLVTVKGGCLRFDGLDVPGYALQFCGLENARIGLVNQGQPLGSARTLLVGVLRRQTNGSWAFVEPSQSIVQSVIQ
ncbi:MAG: hypothetical protein HY986_13280 [Candidatus Melainabacteria bacterium]|nr:hypothetical protein [Candidatus Melainabacteria bacterium]